MEEILKIGEFGALALVTGYLLTKGTTALKELAESNKNLANAVEKLSEKVSTLDIQIKKSTLLSQITKKFIIMPSSLMRVDKKLTIKFFSRIHFNKDWREIPRL